MICDLESWLGAFLERGELLTHFVYLSRLRVHRILSLVTHGIRRA